MRLPMDSPIFVKLQDIIEQAPRSLLWSVNARRSGTKLIQRFGMAEQAINTIYLLGEQPDALCSQIIKNLTGRAFTPTAKGDAAETVEPETLMATEDASDSAVPPTPAKTIDMSAPTPFKMTRSESQESVKDDFSGSFALAQLVFTVGHVAIKHIVYLELVEREFKRRKDENAKRELLQAPWRSIS